MCRPTVILQQPPGFISLIICFRESVPPECLSYANNLALFAQLVTASKAIECGTDGTFTSLFFGSVA